MARYLSSAEGESDASSVVDSQAEAISKILKGMEESKDAHKRNKARDESMTKMVKELCSDYQMKVDRELMRHEAFTREVLKKQLATEKGQLKQIIDMRKRLVELIVETNTKIDEYAESTLHSEKKVIESMEQEIAKRDELQHALQEMTTVDIAWGTDEDEIDGGDPGEDGGDAHR